MASVTIRLIVDPDTGKKNVVISYESEEDALPMEHEDAHRKVVDQLIEGGALKAEELGKIVIEREEEGAGVELPQDEGEQQGETVDQKS